jgi:hypothetical protein
MFRIQDSWKNGSFETLKLGQAVGPVAQFGPLILMCLVGDPTLSITNLESQASFSMPLNKPLDVQVTAIEIDNDTVSVLDRVLLGYSDGSAQVLSILKRRVEFEIPNSCLVPINQASLKNDVAVLLSENFTLYVYALEKNGDVVLMHRLRSSICSLPALLSMDDIEIIVTFSQTYFNGQSAPCQQIVSLEDDGGNRQHCSTEWFPSSQAQITCFCTHESLLMAGFNDNIVRIYKDCDLVSILNLGSAPTALAVDGRKLVVGTADGLLVYRLSDQKIVSEQPIARLSDKGWTQAFEKGRHFSFVPKSIQFNEGSIIFTTESGLVKAYRFFVS